ncbi:MAG: (2Fe-2S)-binding protein [Ignavibacteriales bacterium]|nr:(2Fe-2S)-binding protein [Ignavibacteriales bacterium]
MPEYKLNINGREERVVVEAGTPLLWVLRDELGLTGTKYACGKGLCGSCTVLIDGESDRSCSIPVETVGNRKITTIEGFAADKNHPIFKKWIEHEVSQCGYCQPGQILTVASLLNRPEKPSYTEMETALTGVLCRCGTYPRIKKAVEELLKERG